MSPISGRIRDPLQFGPVWTHPDRRMLIAGCSADAVIPDAKLITGASFVTLEASPAPEAMLIKNGRIAALDTEEALKARIPGAVIVDY